MVQRFRFALLVGLFLIAAGVLAVWATVGLACRELSGTGLLSIDVSQMARGSAQTFCYKDDSGRRLRFVLARGSDGKVRSVFDACRQCFSYGRGYEASDGSLVCRLCGNRYPIDHMLQGKASCVPAKLPHTESGSTAQIAVRDLKAGSWLFQ